MLRNKLLSLLLCALLLPGFIAARAEGESVTYTVAQVQSLCDGIVAYNGANSAQGFIDGQLCSTAGTTAEFYIIALSQSGNYSFGGYESALLSYLSSHEVYSATSREKYALALMASGSTDSYISEVCNEAIGGLGIMSLVFGLHLLNNGCESSLYTTDSLISEILSWQKDDGGWAVMGSWGDVDVTAMTLQALAPHYGSRGDVSSAVDRAIDLLSRKQLDSGGFKTMGAENCESAAQVITALSALGIDPQTDGRFIKNGNSAMTGMMQYYLGDGSFAHTDGANATATMEAFCALTAYRRSCYGQSGLYMLDHAVIPSPAGGDSPRDSNESDGHSGGSSGSSSVSRFEEKSGSDDSDSDNRTQDGESRIIYINGKRYIEATTVSGEAVTINADETQSAQKDHNDQVRPTFGAFQPSATADTSVKHSSASPYESGSAGGYKVYAVLFMLLAGGAACGILFLLKKRGKKNFIAAAIITAAGILFILLTDFRSADSYALPTETDGELTVTLSIRCDTIKGLRKVNYYVPSDGVILDEAEYSAAEGDTVYDVLTRAAGANNILLDNRGPSGAAYIAGINSLYEFDYGDLSGWMYRVNGEFPDVGCQSCPVSDGDRIEWLYTTDIGKDLE